MQEPEGMPERLHIFLQRHNVPALLDAPLPLRLVAVILLLPLMFVSCVMACS